MTVSTQGVIKGRQIKLDRATGLPEGTRVEVRIKRQAPTLEDHGQVRVAGVPFAPGTAVEVIIRPAQNGGHATAAAATDRAARLCAALDKARNTEPVGPLRREELYDRKVLRLHQRAGLRAGQGGALAMPRNGFSTRTPS